MKASVDGSGAPGASGPARPMFYIPSVSAQAPATVILVRADRFIPNPATAADNTFQREVPEGQSDDATSAKALAEMDAVAQALRDAGVTVHVFEDEDHTRPDSVFPNNWLSTHAGGNIAVYPMYASNRRHERRADVLELLKSQYRVQTIVDYSGLEPDGIFLEGTGAMVLDHVSRVAYTARSHRADTHVLERFCTDFGYEPMAFDAVDSEGVPVYHTNVIAAIGTDVAMIALEMIPDEQRRAEVRERLSVNGRTVVELTEQQIRELRQRRGAVWSYAGGSAPLHHGHVGSGAPEPPPGPGRGDRGVLRDRGRRHPHDRAGRRVGAVHDRRCPPRPAPGHRARAHGSRRGDRREPAHRRRPRRRNGRHRGLTVRFSWSVAGWVG